MLLQPSRRMPSNGVANGVANGSGPTEPQTLSVIIAKQRPIARAMPIARPRVASAGVLRIGDLASILTQRHILTK